MSPLAALEDILERSPLWSQPPLAVFANVVVALAFVFVVGAVVIDFKNYHRQPRKVVSGDRSLVETGSMSAFFVAYYLVIKLRWLEVSLSRSARVAMILVGLALVIVGVAFNIWGRIVLKSSWANQIRIFEGQKLLTTGPFSIVRHPLYASLIWIFVGGSLIYSNALSLLLAVLVFVPMMYVRAMKEDALLLKSFGGEYEAYRSRTGLFLPRIRRLPWRT